jgi:hypothetical protein
MSNVQYIYCVCMVTLYVCFCGAQFLFDRFGSKGYMPLDQGVMKLRVRIRDGQVHWTTTASTHSPACKISFLFIDIFSIYLAHGQRGLCREGYLYILDTLCCRETQDIGLERLQPVSAEERDEMARVAEERQRDGICECVCILALPK